MKEPLGNGLAQADGEARVYRCGECGGPNLESERFCEFCRAAIATLRCAACFHMNVPENRNCSGCGEVLGLVPLSHPSELTCAACGGTCEVLDGNPGRLYDCAECGCQFVEHLLLQALLQRRERMVARAPLPALRPVAETVRYHACPVCAQLMHRRNFGRTSGVIVDVCALHGTLFHAGELSRVLAFVEAGGLADARRHQLGLPKPATLEDQKRIARVVAEAMTSAPPKKTATTAVGKVGLVATGVVESSLELLATIGEFVTGDPP